ncbi:hypothetical protein [Nitrosopumilus sp.]|uniref:hypothetical protein n=1 Tax=Nitrosopumilus sp. TaxID=2024843 RepID=UPI0034A03A63
MRNLRNGKYRKYEKIILQILLKPPYDIMGTGQIRFVSKIPKSSCYDVLGKLREEGYIDWIGESQDWTSLISITEAGKDYLKNIQDQNL